MDFQLVRSEPQICDAKFNLPTMRVAIYCLQGVRDSSLVFRR